MSLYEAADFGTGVLALSGNSLSGCQGNEEKTISSYRNIFEGVRNKGDLT